MRSNLISSLKLVIPAVPHTSIVSVFPQVPFVEVSRNVCPSPCSCRSVLQYNFLLDNDSKLASLFFAGVREGRRRGAVSQGHPGSKLELTNVYDNARVRKKKLPTTTKWIRTHSWQAELYILYSLYMFRLDGKHVITPQPVRCSVNTLVLHQDRCEAICVELR